MSSHSLVVREVLSADSSIDSMLRSLGAAARRIPTLRQTSARKRRSHLRRRRGGSRQKLHLPRLHGSPYERTRTVRTRTEATSEVALEGSSKSSM